VLLSLQHFQFFFKIFVLLGCVIDFVLERRQFVSFRHFRLFFHRLQLGFCSPQLILSVRNLAFLQGKLAFESIVQLEDRFLLPW